MGKSPQDPPPPRVCKPFAPPPPQSTARGRCSCQCTVRTDMRKGFWGFERGAWTDRCIASCPDPLRPCVGPAAAPEEALGPTSEKERQ